MSDFTTHATVIASKQDQEAQRKSVGGYMFPLGTVLASVCKDGIECNVVPFIPNMDKTGAEQYSEWHDEQITASIEKMISDAKPKKKGKK